MVGKWYFQGLALSLVLTTAFVLTTGQTDVTPDPLLVNEDGDDGETPNPVILNEARSTNISIGGASVIVTHDQASKELPQPVHKEKDFEMWNPTHVNGEELYQSDIMLTPEQRAALLERKAIISSLNYRWQEASNGFPFVPYVFGDSNVDQTAVQAGIAHWEQNTCIKFGTASNLSQPHLIFIKDSGCWSYIGRIWSWAGQNISIDQGCTNLGIVAHEIGHAMGFFHEQSRSDRDSYVTINTGNIGSGYEGNFDKAQDAEVFNYSVPYDYSSDMHYGGQYFSKNGHLTIATINPLAQELIGARNGLSHRDKLLANRMYNCTDKWVAACGLLSDPCLNDGYLGANCTCVCPPGTSGTDCGTESADYYDSLLSGCSKKITSPTTVSSPGYPSNYPTGLQCVKWIVAPTCFKVQLTVNNFQMYQQTTCNDGNPCCNVDGLEIRTSNLFDGDWYCGTMIAAGTTFTSTSNQMILYLKTSTNYYSGFSANVQFVQDPSCTTVSTSTPSTIATNSTASTRPNTTTGTTMSTSTSSPTTSSNTTSAPAPNCMVEVWNNVFYLTSPNFGIQNYPNNQYCDTTGGSSDPRLSVFKFQPFKLQPQVNKKCVDYLRFTYPYGVTKDICGDQTGKAVRLPTFSFRATFSTDATITRPGFNISLEATPSVCHKRFDLTTLNETGVFSTPNYPMRDTLKSRMCELWITAPAQYHVRLDFLGFKLESPCQWNSLVVNLKMEHNYPPATSSRYCGTTLPPSMTSSMNEAYLVYMTSKPTIGFSVRYTVVP